jgi:photosystem II stability/assembly factor-like uncharacterized protein
MISLIPPPTRFNRVVRIVGIVCLLATFSGVILVTAQKDDGSLPPPTAADQTAVTQPTTTLNPETKARLADNFGKLPLSFEINKGQVDQVVKFLAHGTGYDLFLTSTEAVLRVHKPRPPQADKSKETDPRKKPDANANVREGTVLRLKLLGANATSKTEGQDELPGKVNYFTGNDPEKWHRDVPTYKKALFKDVYPGIDVVYYGNQHELEYDFVLAPRANPKLIRFTVEGADKTRLDKTGSLRLSLKHGEVSLNKPVIYQVDEKGNRREIKGEYVVKGNEVRFKLEQFDSSKPLIIDPVLSYSTLLGSSSNDSATGIAVDSVGSAYVTGQTESTSFPTTAGSFKSTSTRSGAFVTKLNPAGSALVYSTYLSGEGFTSAFAIDVDSAGNAHVTGQTSASDFPTVNGLKTTSNFFKTTDAAANWNNQNSGLTGSVSAIAVARSAPNTIYAASQSGIFHSTDAGVTWTRSPGTGLQGSSFANVMAVDPSTASIVYLGQSFGVFKSVDGGNTWAALNSSPLNFSSINAIAIDPSTPATIYVGTGSGVFKSTNGGSTWILQNNFGVAGTPNVRALAIDPTTPSTIYAGTFGNGVFKTINGGGIWTAMNNGMGGSSPTNVSAIIIDPATPTTLYTGHGFSFSDGGINKSVNGGTSWTPLTNGVPNAGVIAMAATSSGIYAAITNSGGVIKTSNGGTSWTNVISGLWSLSVQTLATHPTNAAIVYAGTTGSGVQDAFITKLNASGSGLLFSTLLGGSRDESGNGIAVDSSGNIAVAGHTGSTNFPVVNAVKPSVTLNAGCSTGYVTKVNPSGPSYTFSTYLGGAQCDVAHAVAIDSSNNVYVTGRTGSTDFPTANAFQPALAGPQFNSDAFVSKLTPAGAFVYSTYLGGNGSDAGFAITADASGNAYVTGFTSSSDFPTKNPIQASNAGSGFATDVFVTKFNSQGSALVYSTYLGGTGNDTGRGIALDSANNAYIAGFTESLDFPLVAGALRTKSAIYKSTNGAASWSNDNYGFEGATTGNFGGIAVTGLVVHPTQSSTIYAGTGGGVFRSTNGGRTWTAMNNGLTSRNVVAIVMDPSTPSTLYVAVSGFSGVRGIYKTTDGGTSWNRRSNGIIESEPVSLAIDPDTPNTLYVGVSFCCITGSHIYKTTDGADNWAPLVNATPLVPASIAIDPFSSSTIYVADAVSPGAVHKGTNGGTTWQNLGLSGAPPVRWVVVSPLTQGLLYAGADQSLFKSVNGGTSWTQVPNRSGKVVFDPVSSSTVYVLSNPFEFNSQGLFKSTDNGQTWVQMNKGLNTPQVTALAIDPLRPSTLHLGSAPSGGQEGFVTRINPAGSALIYSTFIGGPPSPQNFFNTNASAHAIAVDAFSNAYVSGVASSPGFPVTPGSYQPFNRGFNDAFISKLTLSHIISGRVVDGGGAPVSDAEVVLRDGTSLSAVFTESDGSYQFSRLRTGGNYTVSAGKPHFTMTPASHTLNNLNSDQVRNFTATASAAPFHTISGQVTNNSVGLPGVTVTLSGSQSGLRTTDSNGNFSFELAAAGNYTVTPSIVGFTFGPVNQTFNNLSANQAANFSATRQNFVVTNANNHGAGSLRDAITNANATPGPDTITFNIPGSGVKTISVVIPLPEITERVVIDATTQPGYAGTPLIELDGLPLGNFGGNGLVIKASNSTVRGLSIGNFRGGNAIFLTGCDNNTIQANYLGVAANGTTGRSNSRGIVLTNSSNNLIGGTTAAARNVIAGNQSTGLVVEGNNNVIQGNFIGTNAAGTAALANFGNVVIENVASSDNLVGGTAIGAGNLLSGSQWGVSSNGTRTTIQGNRIGTDVTGTNKIPNSVGVNSIGPDSLIGGLVPAARNIISGNQGDGVSIRGTGSKLQGNYIGTDITGALALGNNGNGVSANENALIGGTVPEARNIIAASGQANVALGQSGFGAPATVQGNYIGTDATGSRALGGSFAGIAISSSNNVVGGLTAGARNVISGNTLGINLGGFSTGTVGNVIQGNFIGVNAAGTGPLPNTNQGIAIADAANNIVGGTQTGAGNRIAFNGGPGLTISTGTGNSIRRNAIFSNNGLGIDLAQNGVTPNDNNDGDTGPNHLQNFPVISGVMSTSSSTTIQGSLKSIPNTTFQIDFYSNAAVDPSGNGEGAQFINSTSVNTNSNGDATINVTFPVGLAAGRVVTATATDPNGNTSEFSAANSTAAVGSVQFSLSAIKALEDVGSLTLTVLRTGGSTGSLSIQYATVNGTAVAGQDYTSTSGTLTFAGGETSKTIQIPITSDVTTEADETFNVVLSHATNLEILGAPSVLTVTVQDSTTPLSISVNSVSATEGNAGTTTQAVFTISLSAATSRAVSGNYATGNFGASGGAACGTAGADFVNTSGTFSFDPGTTTINVPVTICGDNNAEANENLRLVLSNPTGATLQFQVGVATIIDDDVLELLHEEPGQVPFHAAAVDALTATRDPFRVVGVPEWFPTGADKNTRVALFARNLQLNPGEFPSAVFVTFAASNGFFFDVFAENVVPIPNTDLTQVVVRLPNNLAPGNCTVIIRAHSRVSNAGTIRIAP